jgi:hypothetical protein
MVVFLFSEKIVAFASPSILSQQYPCPNSLCNSKRISPVPSLCREGFVPASKECGSSLHLTSTKLIEDEPLEVVSYKMDMRGKHLAWLLEQIDKQLPTCRLLRGGVYTVLVATGGAAGGDIDRR